MTFREEIIGDARLILGRYRRGPTHYKWTGDAVSEKAGRKRALKAYPQLGACESCGAAKTERHHKDGNTANNDPSNIAALCRRCHMEADGRLAEARSRAPERLPRAIAAAAAEKLARTHCKRGHPLSGNNLFRNSAGSRGCKACRRIHKARHREKSR